MKENKTISKKSFSMNKKVLLVLTVILFFSSVKLYNHFVKTIEKYTIVNGYVEKSSETMAYIFKDENVVNTDTKTSATPIIEQFKRVSKNDTIAVYNNSNYEKYSEQISQMDTQIQSLIKDLPAVYSSDISNIDNEISEISIKATKVNSYLKMQEYKTNLDNLSYKKVIKLGELSPTGSKIRELIEKREELEEKRKKESDNIVSPISGIVSYNLDGLEYLSNTTDILTYNVSKLDEIINLYQTNNTSNFGIKVMNNFEAYIIVKQESGENDTYIKQGKKYTIKLTDSNSKINVTLIKTLSKDSTNYLIFKVTNGIEQLEDSRSLSAEIIWSRVEGLAVPIKYIKTSENLKYKYITIIKNGEYINVPINITLDSDSICIIDNMSKEEKSNLGIEEDTSVTIYDEIIA